MASSWLRRFLAGRPRSSVPVRPSLHCLQLEDRVVPYSLGARWLSTAANPGPLTQGDATVITWGFVRDGLTIPGNPETGEPGSASTLVAALDAAFGGGAGGLNYANRPWFHLFQEVYDRWSAVTGITFQYEPNDDGAPFTASPGRLNTRADLRIGGHPVDGLGGVLAYAYTPDETDLVVDTDDLRPGSQLTDPAGGYLKLRNVLMHEIGHGIGLLHTSPVDGVALMEPLLSTNFDGPQFDDILGAQRLYGDTKEKNAGNDTLPTATPLGVLTAGQSVTLGRDANATSQFVAPTQTDFLSVDGATDVDYFAMIVPASTQLTVTIQPVGPVYQAGPESGSSPAAFNARTQSDLRLDLLDAAGSLLASVNQNGLGGSESILRFPTSGGGTYYARVRGTQDKVQFYQLTATASPTVPVSIARAPGQPANANTGPVAFEVTFAAPVAGFDAADVQFTPGTIAAGLTVAVTPNGSTGTSYFVTVTGMTGVGTVGIAVPDAAASSVAFGDPSEAAATTPDQLVAFDNVRPGVTFNPIAIGPTQAGAVPVTLTFSEPVNAVAAAALQTTNAAVQNFARVSDTTYTFTLVPATAGAFGVTLPDGATSDPFGNPLAGATIGGSWDQAAPTGIVSALSPPTITAGPAVFAVIFSEPVVGFTAADVLFTGSMAGGQLAATVTADASRGSTSYLVSVTGMAGQGVIHLVLPAGAVTDLAGNPNGTAIDSDRDVWFDGTGPGVTIATDRPFPTTAASVAVTVTFTEPVTGFTAGDLHLSPAGGAVTISNFTARGDGRTYTFDLVRVAEQPFTLTIPDGAVVDAAGNPNTGAVLGGAFDTAGPDAAVTRVSPAVLSAGPAVFRVAFTEPVAGLTPAAFTFAGTLAAQPLTAEVAPDADPNSYLVQVSGMTGEGTLSLVLTAGAVTDLAGNPNRSPVLADAPVTFDDTAPAVGFTTPAAFPTAAAAVPVTVTFSEPVVDFTEASVLVYGATVLADFAAGPGGRTFTFTLIRTTDGPFQVVVPDFAAHDAAGNPVPHALFAGAFDTTPPAATVTPTAAAFQNAPATFLVEFGEPVDPAAFPPADLVLGGTARPRSATVAATGPASFLVTVTGMNRDGTVTLQLAAGAVTDAAGNRLVPPPPVTVDYTAPRTRPQSLVGTEEFGVGTDTGITPAVQFFNPDGSLRFSSIAFDPAYAGGVRTAVADFNGDGVSDLVVGNGPGAASLVLVLGGANGSELFRLQPFEDAYTGGVFIATGDVDGDGVPDLIVSPDQGGGPRVQVYRGTDFAKIADFFGIDDPNFRGGARAAAGDLNGDGRADLIVSAGYGGGPRVAGYDGLTITSGSPARLFPDFFVFEPALRNGAYVTVGDLNGDGVADLIAGGGPGGGPRVLALDGAGVVAGQGLAAPVLANFFAGNPDNRGGVRVAVKNLDGDEFADLVVGDGTGAGSRVTAYYGTDLAGGLTPPGFTFDAIPGFAGGVFVG